MSVEPPSPPRWTGCAAVGTSATRNSPIQYRDGDRVVEAVGSHWLLDTRRHNIRRKYSGTGYQTEEETHEDHLYVLLPDGSLKLVVVMTADTTVLHGGALRSHRSSKEHFESRVRRAPSADVRLRTEVRDLFRVLA